jgi:DNA-binding MarR family transcriptional regulator
VKALEQRGLLARRTSEADQRSSVVQLTLEGEALFAELSAQWRTMLSEVTAEWAPKEIERFARDFERFAAALDRYASGAGVQPHRDGLGTTVGGS